MRWRTQQELFDGKGSASQDYQDTTESHLSEHGWGMGIGQFVCGNVRCEERGGLAEWEVDFAYVEHHQHKSARVKVTLCPRCADKYVHVHMRVCMSVCMSVFVYLCDYCNQHDYNSWI